MADHAISTAKPRKVLPPVYAFRPPLQMAGVPPCTKAALRYPAGACKSLAVEASGAVSQGFGGMIPWCKFPLASQHYESGGGEGSGLYPGWEGAQLWFEHTPYTYTAIWHTVGSLVSHATAG